MIKRCVEQILNLYNFIDGIMVADEEGNIEYYQTFRPDLNDLKMEKIIGKIFSIFIQRLPKRIVLYTKC